MIKLRPENKSDWGAIRTVTELAFKTVSYADGDEQDLIEVLRKSGSLSLSLVALDEGELIGQVSFSPAILSSGAGPWFALGPISVTPARHGEGIGSQLIKAGLSEISKRGALGCILTGNPAYYRRFGFALSPDNCPAKEPKEFFMVKLLGDEKPQGEFSFDAGFYQGK